MGRLNLYLVQDNDRPMHVVAEGWQKALEAWKRYVAKESRLSISSLGEPEGIQLVCNSDALLLP